MLNLPIVLEDSARVTPDRTAVVFGDMRLPYSLINSVANQVANLLVARGIGRGDKVALACPTCPTSRSSTTASSRPAPPSSR